MPISQDWLTEFEESTISPALAIANVRWIEGSEAVHEFLEKTISERQRNQDYLTTGNTKTVRRYSHLEHGAWIAYGVDSDGHPGEIAYAKPKSPRKASDGRLIKYETPPGQESRPLLPEMGPAWESISALHNIRLLPGETPWQAIKRFDVPVVVTEGFKKALALIEQGQPAIALRGITQWHPKGERELWPELAQFCDGRPILMAFDQDKKIKTRVDVSRQGQQLGQAIQAMGSEPRFLTWHGAKGIDDALVNEEPSSRVNWLKQRIKKSIDLKQWRRLASIRKSQSILDVKPPDADIETKGRYLPQLPPLTMGAVHGLIAPMNSGKSTRMGKDWVKPWAKSGGISVVLAPLNNLGQQIAEAWDLPHIHDYGTDADNQQVLWSDIRDRGGIVACPNSAHRILRLIPEAPLLLIIDEAAQTLSDASEGGTLKSNWADRWEDLISLMESAAGYGAIALAEAGLDSETIGLVQFLSGAEEKVTIRHEKEVQPWPVKLHTSTQTSGFRSDLFSQLREGKHLLYLSTSQAECKRLSHWAKSNDIDHERVDSQTNEMGRYELLFQNPDQWLKERQPQLLILSPSAKTGVSIEGGVAATDAYFHSVWAYFPSLDGDTQRQLLGRYRPPVPRYIHCPAFIQPSPGEGPGRKLIKREFDLEAGRYAKAAGFGLGEADSQDNAIKSFLAARRQRRWAQKINAADSLRAALVQTGHDVQEMESIPEKAASMVWRSVKEGVARADSAYHAGLEIDPEEHTTSWAHEAINSVNATYEKRCRANKILTAERFPGMNWDNADLWYEAFFCPRCDEDAKGMPNQGPLAPGASLWAEADHFQSLWAEDSHEAKGILEKRLQASHLLPKNALKAAMAAKFKPLIEKLIHKGCKVVPGCSVTKAIKSIALNHSTEIKQYWRLNCTKEQSAVAITNKVLKKLGFLVARLKKVTSIEGRLWAYTFTAVPTWQKLVVSRYQALGSSGTNLLEELFNKFVPPPAQNISSPTINEQNPPRKHGNRRPQPLDSRRCANG